MVVKLLHDFVGSVAWGSLDYLLVDLPPGTGDVQLTLAQSAGLTGAVIVTTPQGVALDVARKGLRMFQQVKVPILGVIENMSGYVCSQCGHRENIFMSEGGNALAAGAGVPFLGTIPLDPAVVRSGEDGVPLSDGTDASPAARAFGLLADAFEREVARVNGAAPAGPNSWRLTDGCALEVVWEDGARSSYEPYALRLKCPCAYCVDERTGKKVLDDARVPLDVKIVELRPVGLYGFSPRFSDGHDTGIFTFQKLRSMDGAEAGQTLSL
jgi:ATP-binding protein involved in chromosome partitioning